MSESKTYDADHTDQHVDDVDCERGTSSDEPLLEEHAAQYSTRKTEQSARLNWTVFLILQLFLLAIYIAIFFSIPPKRQSLVYSPAFSAVRHKKVRYNGTLIIESPYNGLPDAAVDQAWTELIYNMNIAVPKSDLERIGTHSIPIPDTDGMYFAGLGVFHELHCIKRLRQYTWREHYFPNTTKEEQRLNRLHTDHCLEILRQAALCRADTTLFTLQWSEQSPRPRADFSQEHECVDWDALNSWAAERRVDAGKPGILTHPKFGVAYHEGESSRIGASEDMSPTIIEG